jgi:hypothetical protein
MDELYNVQFTDGTYSPASGAISLNDFRNKIIGAPSTGIQTLSYSFTNLSNIPGSNFVLGTWRSYVYQSGIVLPSGFSTSSSNFRLEVTMSGKMRYGPEQYVWCGMVKEDGSASCTVDLSAGWSSNRPSWWSYNGNTTYTNATKERTTLNKGQFSAGDTVKLMFGMYNSYWMSGHNCDIVIEW